MCVAFATVLPPWQSTRRHDPACLHLLLNAVGSGFLRHACRNERAHGDPFADQAAQRCATTLRQRAEAIVFVLWQADRECADDFKSFKSCPGVTVLIRRKAAYQIVATCAY